MVVDDEHEMRLLTRLLLEQAVPGIDVREAESGKEALAILERLRFDVVVSDHRMSGMDGESFLRQASHIIDSKRCILMTAYANQKLRARAHAAGWVFIEKGGDPSDIVTAIEAVLKPQMLPPSNANM